MSERSEDAGTPVQPDYELKVCPFCGMPAKWKYDRRGRAYLSCHHCQTRVFAHSHVALAGIQILQEYVLRGVQRHRQLVSRLVERKLSAIALRERTGFRRPARVPARSRAGRA